MSFTTIHFDASDYCGTDFDARRVKLWATNNAEDQTIHDPDGHVYIGSGNGTIAADGQASITVPVPETGWNPITCQTTLHLDYPDRNSRNRNGRETKTFGPFTVPEGNISGLITNVALTSNVASLTTSAAHGLQVGYTVTIAGYGAPFDGEHVVTEVTSTSTFDCVIVAADVASTAAAALFTSNDIQLNDLVEEQTVPPEYAGALVAQLEAIRDEALAGGSLIVVSGGSVDLDNTKADGYLIGYKVTATTTIEGVTFAAGSYIFERDSSVYGGWTYRTLDVGEGVVPAPDAVAPTAGTLASSAITDTTFTLTVSGAADETALAAAPYAFSTDDGGSWTAYQTAAAYAVTGKTASTAYQCKHRTKDAAGNVSTGTAITVTTGAASLAPATVGSLFAHYDPSNAGSLTGSTPVSQINDLSGNARHATAQTVGADLGASKFGTLPALLFTGTQRMRWLATGTLSAASGYSIGFVYRPINPADSKVIISMLGGHIDYNTANDSVSAPGTGNSNLGTGQNVSDEDAAVCIIINVSSTDTKVYRNGTLVATGGAGVNLTDSIALGSLYSSTGSSFANMDLGETWFHDRVLTAPEIAGEAAYMVSKWAL